MFFLRKNWKSKYYFQGSITFDKNKIFQLSLEILKAERKGFHVVDLQV